MMLQAVYMTHPSKAHGPGYILPDGRYVFVHYRGICLYLSEAAALAYSPGAAIHRMADADDIGIAGAVNP